MKNILKNKTVPLQKFLKEINDDKIVQKILEQFKSREKNSIEEFLHNKAITFEKNSLSATHLIYDNKGEKLLGYFTLANKSLIISKKELNKMSKNQQKKFLQSGRILENGSCIVNSFLVAQIGKNYNIENEDMIKGLDILELIRKMLLIVKEIINTKYVWLECEDNKKLIDFYSVYGFNLVNNYNSKNNLKTMILKI